MILRFMSESATRALRVEGKDDSNCGKDSHTDHRVLRINKLGVHLHPVPALQPVQI